VATALITLFIPNRYTSVARILPGDSQSGSLGSLAMMAATAGLSLPNADSPDAAYVDILESRSVREALLNTRFRFHARSWRFGADQLKDETLYDYLGKPNIDKAVLALRERVSITRDLKTRLLTLSVETESPELSQQVAQRLVALLNDFAQTKARTKGSEKAAFAEQRLAEARTELGKAQAAFQRFLEANRNYALSADPAVKLEGARLEMEYRLREQLITTLAQNREQALLEAKNDMPILNVLDPGNLPIDKSGPARTITVLMTFLLVTLLAWAIRSRRSLSGFFALS
jgi:capsule polysaccharide export protein KpsE/RkpR